MKVFQLITGQYIVLQNIQALIPGNSIKPYRVLLFGIEIDIDKSEYEEILKKLEEI